MRALFRDRSEAGDRLAERLLRYRDRSCIVLAIPRGGVPVGYEVSRRLDCPLDLVLPRKLPIPWSPEAGFGAIMRDGTRVLDREMVARLGLADSEIDAIGEEVLQEIRRRAAVYRGKRSEPEIAARVAILVDDGLASGYTMLAAIRAVRKQRPQAVVAAVPVTPRSSLEKVARSADETVALYVSDALPFAVASFYRSFPDLTDAEVKRYLEEASAQ